MKLNNKCKILLICFVFMCLPIISMASEKFTLPKYTEEYQKWLELPEEERKNCIEPPMYELSKESENASDEKSLGDAQLPAKYTMSYYGDVKDQGDTKSCWAYSAATVFDTNYYNTNASKKRFSNMHMEYVTATEYGGLNRRLDDGGNMMLALAYATNGMGIALESSMPKNITTSTLKKVKPDSKVSNYVILTNEYEIKKHIYEYGAVSSCTYIGDMGYFSNPNIYNEKNLAYLCANKLKLENHAITLIGWDDNYTNAAFPGYEGAYVVLNSYGKNFGNNGIYYIFYDDVYVQSAAFGVRQTEDIDYDYLYQHDKCGVTGIIEANYTNTVYVANVFNRKNMNDKEILKDVSVYIPQAGKITLYINSNGSKLNYSSAPYKRTVYIEEPGYHTISLDDGIELTSSKFVVGIKCQSLIAVEMWDSTGWYSSVTANSGESYVSEDDVDYDDMTTIGVGVVNACIKAFTVIPEEVSKLPESDVVLANYVFDAKYYLEKNPDLVPIFGNNKKALTWHFLNYGINEGRIASPAFSVDEYMRYNQDLARVISWNDRMAYFNHFISYGRYEGRRSSSEYEPLFYKYYYADLTNLINTELIEHYVTYGRHEGRLGALDLRTESIVFDLEIYKQFNQDLVARFGHNANRYKQHWLQYGIAEGRKSSILYDSNAYRYYNQDLARAGIYTNKALLDHFVKCGINELRDSSYVFEISTYLKYNPEIKQVYGNDYKEIFLHFKNFGLEEERKSSNLFNIKSYMKYNNDLYAVYGTNKKYFCIHYMLYGRNEGRRAI